jgi:superfamily II DNA or RNA helicase
MAFELRNYQLDILASVRAGWAEHDRQLVVAPTGSGKTVMFSHLCSDAVKAGGRALVLVDQRELVIQAVDKLRAATGIAAAVECAAANASLPSPVVVATVQTMTRRLARWPSNHFTLVIADEADKSVSATWQRVLNHFDGTAKVCGFTATPHRTDLRNLGEYYQRIAAEVGLFDLVRQGYLAPIAVKMLPIKIDLSAVKVKDGDYDPHQVDAAVTPHLREVARAIREHASFRRTLVFVPLIATSKRFVEICREEGISAEHIDGTSEDRAEKLKRFSEWEFDVLVNSALLLRGVDIPSISCVVMLRPTKSQTLYQQAIGRGTRIADDKDNLLLLDFLYQAEKKMVCHPAHLIAKTQEQADAMTELTEAAPGGGERDLQEVNWEAQEKREAALRRKLEDNAKKKLRLVDAASFCALMSQPALMDYEPVMQWECAPVTEGQLNILRRNGIDEASVRGRGHASQLIDLINTRQTRGLCSPKQARLLNRLGVKNAARLTLEVAGRILDERIGRRQRA